MAIDKACVTRAGHLQTRIVTRARASVAAAVGYADGTSHGAQTVGEAGADGVYVWEIVVAPTAPLGRAEVLVSVQDRTPTADGGAHTTGEGAQGGQPFEVRAAC